MRGQFLHNSVCVERLARQFRSVGAHVELEVPVRCSASTRFIDLLALRGNQRIAVEVELDGRRLATDFEKAATIAASELWLVVAQARVAGKVRRKLARRVSHPTGCRICVLTLGQALQRVTDCFPLSVKLNANEKQHTNQPR